MADQAGFLGRWSSRKLEQTGSDDRPLPKSAAAEAPEVPASEQKQAASPVTDADLPALETLGEDADFSGFLSEGVSEALRKRALKQLFHGAQFNIRDGLNEYDDDFSTFVPLGDTVTRQMKQWAEDAARNLVSEDAEEEASATENRSPHSPLEALEETANGGGAISPAAAHSIAENAQA